MPDLSIVIPTRRERYLTQTIEDIIAKAESDIEIIVVLDGYWPEPPLPNYPNLKIIHHGTIWRNKGMRQCINAGMAIAKGKYIMKADGHILFDQGFDTKLMADCDDDWVVIPRRVRLDPEKWEIAPDKRPPIDYQFLTYPYIRTYNPDGGLHGDEWRDRYYRRKKLLIDDNMSTQGSLYFTTKKWWDKMIAPMNTDLYGPFIQEAQEICNNTWLGGGRVVVNKKTWYAHWHKGKAGKGYGFSNARYAFHQAERDRGRRNCINYWLDNKYPKAVRKFEWLIDHFWPVPTWPENWREQIIIDRQKEENPELKNRIDLAKYFAQLKFHRGAEIGAGFGYYSEILFKSIPGLELIVVDNWNNQGNTNREKVNNASGEDETRKKLAPYKATIIKKDSLEAAKDVADNSLDFVFLDADHSYDAVKADIEAWIPKIKRGGIIAGHDYYVFASGNSGVIDAVDEFVTKHNFELKIVPWDKTNPTVDDRQPSWYFFKI